MDRLTQRDTKKKGIVYFVEDAETLTRGTVGRMTEKSTMTNKEIHSKFVALDRTLDKLAAYEDTGLEPHEVTELKEKVEQAEKELRGQGNDKHN